MEEKVYGGEGRLPGGRTGQGTTDIWGEELPMCRGSWVKTPGQRLWWDRPQQPLLLPLSLVTVTASPLLQPVLMMGPSTELLDIILGFLPAVSVSYCCARNHPNT